MKGKLPNFEKTGRAYQGYDFICDADTFSTKACYETLEIQSITLNSNYQQVVVLLKCSMCEEVPYVCKAKIEFRARFNNLSIAQRSYR